MVADSKMTASESRKEAVRHRVQKVGDLVQVVCVGKGVQELAEEEEASLVREVQWAWRP